MSNGFCLASVLVSSAFCQLQKFESCAIILLSWRWRLAPVHESGVQWVRLTMRAADGGYAPRFLGIFPALGFFRFDGESTLPPTAANAPRWLAKHVRSM